MNETRQRILKYLYDHKYEPFIVTDTEMEVATKAAREELLFETDYLAQKGYLTIKSKVLSGDMFVQITATGVDMVESYDAIDDIEQSIELTVDDAVHTHDVQSATVAAIENGIVHIGIRDELYRHIEQYIQNEDYFHAVEEAYKFVRERLKDVSGSEKATEAFGYEANNQVDYAKIFGHEPIDDIEKDFFKGVRFLHLAVQFLRNEKSHSLATTLDKNIALQYITLASLAYDLISRGEE